MRWLVILMYIAHKFRIYQSNKNDDYTSSYDNIKELKLFGSLSYLKSRILNQQTDFFREDR